MLTNTLRCSSLIAWLLAGLAAQAPKAPKLLEPIDLFRLDYFLVAGAEDPRFWLDATHYAVLDGGKAAPGRAVANWSVVDAKDGSRASLVDGKRLRGELKTLLPAVAAEALEAALAEAGNWTWDANHTRFVLSVHGDLLLGGRDGAVQRLTDSPAVEESCVSFAPDGAAVAWVAGNNLWLATTADGAVRALTTEGNDHLFYGRLDWVYQEELYGRGNFQAYWWSPDSARIALLRLDESPVPEFVLVDDQPARPKVERVHYPKAGEANPNVDLGILDVRDGSTRWCDLEAYPIADRLIVRVTWAPASNRVLFQLQDRAQTWLDLMAVDAATGVVTRQWRETSDCWVEAGPEPRFLADGSYLWLSERDGCRHVYHYTAGGDLQAQLTRGEWQVKEIVDVDAAAGCAFVLADKDSPLETHLYRLQLEDGELQRITKGRGTFAVSMAPDHATFVARWSSAETPPSVTVRDLDDRVLREVAAPRGSTLRGFALGRPEFVQVPTRDGFLMEAMLIKPADFDATRRYPIVQHTYSGPHTPRVRDEWGGADLLWHHYLAQRGHVVFVCDNRSASGKGRKHARACWRQLGQSELADLSDAVDWLGQQPFADTSRVALWGWSYGGFQTLYNLTHSQRWKCGIAVNAVTDWRNYDTIYTERYQGLPADNAAGYDASSVVAAVGNLSGHLLLIAAAMDDNVHMQNSLQFLRAMQAAGKDCDFMVYPGVRHGIEDLQQQIHLRRRMERFLKERL